MVAANMGGKSMNTNTSNRAISEQVKWPKQINRIPKEVFGDPDIFEMEMEQIFYGPEWHMVAHEAEVPNKGDFKTFDLGRRPILIVRGADDKVRVFYNTCTHRGTQVETSACGNRNTFLCQYHQWSFNTEGALVGCPGFKEFSPGFDKANYGLPELQTAEYLGVIFVTASTNAPPLQEWLGEMVHPLADILVDGRLKLLGYQKVMYASNWKAYNDNDGYHAPLLHSAFRMLNWQGGKGRQIGTQSGHNAIEGELSLPKGETMLRDPSLIEFKGTDPKKGSRVVQLFPLAVATKHLDTINLRFAIPRGVASTEVHYAYFGLATDSDEMLRHRVRQCSNLLGPCGMISMEDASIFQRVHLGTLTPGQVQFQKGVKQTDEFWFDFKQNDEASFLPKWEHYRKLMNFERRSEA
jgi:phenylpropionate dioxygenase-like ring-hydroxylating dioxygenase large terminal subunit